MIYTRITWVQDTSYAVVVFRFTTLTRQTITPNTVMLGAFVQGDCEQVASGAPPYPTT